MFIIYMYVGRQGTENEKENEESPSFLLKYFRNAMNGRLPLRFCKTLGISVPSVFFIF